jgi:iron-sulfur cluster repair protein YtfE (RIC family)
MKLIHDIHRAATSLLAEGAERPGTPSAELAELRGFVVAALRHHHESEDIMLWPMLQEADPGVAAGLDGLTGEHHSLDAALDTLSTAEIDAGTRRVGLAAAASAAVRDLVRQHLAHEESLTFPAMRSLTNAQWAQFSRAAMESAPAAGAHLQIGLMEEVGDPDDVATVLAGLPAPAAQALPVLREQARVTLSALRSGAGAAS